MARIKIRIAAKTDVGLERQNNEDNFQVASNLSITPMRWVNNEICNLDKKGALLVVADGMGGMNAGEVASQIAIDTIREEFSPNKITTEIMKNRYSIEKFMNDVIVKADTKIKDVSKNRLEPRGMGTTIVIAWLLDELLYVSWCGDSRAYVFNPQNGIHRLTKDHSYVQQLVDAGKLDEDEAFDFPDSNIITRCLCDAKQKAEPECLDKPYPVCNDDIILLCTDGLCGMIRDVEIQSVMNTFNKDMTVLADNLVHAALTASGSDNCTVCLCQILSGCKTTIGNYFEKSSSNRNGSRGKLSRLLIYVTMCIISLMIGIMVTWWAFKGDGTQGQISTMPQDTLVVQPDTVGKGVDTDDKQSGIDTSHGDSNTPPINADIESRGIDSKIKGLTIPKVKSTADTTKSNKNGDIGSLTKNNGDSQNESRIEVVKDVVEAQLPEGVSLQQFAQQHGMNYLDMKRLNPNIKDWKTVKPGIILNVYKK